MFFLFFISEVKALQEKILLVDDEEKILQVVQAYLEKEGYLVYTSTSGQQALEIFHKVNPDLLVLDLMLPDLTGQEICAEIRKESNVWIMMLTAKTTEEDKIQGFTLGADDYLTKPFSPRELVARVKALLRRNGKQLEGSFLDFHNGDLCINEKSYEVRKKGELVNLTPNEFKILLILAKHPSQAFSRWELINLALGYDYEGYERTIDTHIKNLRQKVEDDSKKPLYLLTVYGIGYKFGG